MFALLALSNLRNGKPASLSPKQIVSGLVNLMDARNMLAPREFAVVYLIYTEICKHKEKILFRNFSCYSEYLLKTIISQFDIAVPYYRICGNPQFRTTADLAQEERKMQYRKIAQDYLNSNQYKFSGDNKWNEFVKMFVQEFD